MKRLSYIHPVHTTKTQFSSLFSTILGLFFLIGSINVYSQDCTVLAGDDQQICVNATLTLQGQITGVTNGAGTTWSQTAGPAVTIVSPASLETEVVGIAGGSVYTFTLSTVCLDGTPVSDDVIVTVLSVTIADAGDDITFCNGGGNLAANTPGVDETGEWSIIGDNYGITISTPSSPTSAVTLSSTNTGTALLRWTINHSNGCSSSDDVLITNAELSEAVISSAPDVCGQTTTTLVAESPLSGTGLWTQQSGPNTATISDDQSSTTNVTGLIAGTYVFKWTISGNALCDPKSQTAEFDVTDPAIAGDDQILCNVTSTNLEASVSVGEWSVESKPAGAPNPVFSPDINTHNATVNGLNSGVYRFMWTVGAGACESSDEVNITVRPSITIEEIVGTTICAGGQINLTAAAAGGTGSFNYQWQYNNAGNWENVGSNSNSFTTPALNVAGNFVYRVIVSDQLPADNGGCQTTSSTTTITVVGDPSFTAQPAALTTLCNAGNTTLSIVADENTGTPELLYQWQISSSDSPFEWSNITGANNNSYTTPNLTQTTFYRMVLSASGNGCASANSSAAKVEINTINAGSIGSNQTICTSTSPATLTSVANATAEGTITYQWQISTDGTDFVDISEAELATFAPGNLATDTWYRREATSTLNGVACSALSNVVKITVTNKPVVDNPGNFVFCNGAATTAIAFTGTPAGLTFNWTNNNTSIGLAASGTGNISSFTATNTTNAPITATITVIPEITDGSSCAGDAITFTITVNPTPAVNAVSNKEYCGGSTTSIIELTGTVAGTVYSWTNNNTSIGLASSGTGNIPTFNALNAGTEPIVATIVVTPTYTNAGVGCTGTPRNFTITVNPIPTITSASSLSICSGSSVGYTITSNTTGATFTWTAALQSGVASGFSAGSGGTINQVLTNTSNSPAVVRFTIIATGPEPAECAGTAFTLDVTVLPAPSVISTPEASTLCSGSETDIALTTNITGATVTYSWTAALLSGTASGFSNGNGAAIAQTLTNTSNEQAVVRYTITPAIGTCIGAPIVQDIAVNPSGQINLPANQRHCAGAAVPAFVFTTSRPDGETTYTWTNSNADIGLAVSGSGNLPAFTATNTTLGPITASIQVTPVYSNNGSSCAGTPVTFTITINPKGQVDKPADRVVCPGGNVEVNFNSDNTGGTTTFTWTNTNTAIGLTASGNGNISFTAVNSTLGPLTAQISVTPVYANSGVSCSGDPKVFSITVNPVGQVNKPSNVILCDNSNSSPIVFQTNNTGGTTTYAWTNNNTSIGLAASGTGNISSFVAKNTGTTVVVATVTVTPTFTLGSVSCIGSPEQFTITVNPVPTITSASSLSICSGSSVGYTITSNTTGATFTWTAALQSGVASGFSAGSGNTISQVLTNTSSSPAVVRYTIIASGPEPSQCAGSPFSLDVTVIPAPTVVATPEASTLCSGSETDIALTTNITGATVTYSWTAALRSGTASGFSNGSGATIAQTLTNTSNEQAVVRYTITPAIGTCIGTPIVQDIAVNPSGQINLPANQRHCAGAAVPTFVFTTSRPDGETTYTWTNSNAAIGLAVSGSGNLPAFTATNTTLGPITATIQVTPVYSNNGSSCAGTPVTFTITINPKGQVDKPADRIVCPGGNVEVNFNSNNTGGTTTFSWTNTNAAIGLTATGNGNISFTAVNSTTGPLTAQISVTPVYTNSGVSCSGDPKVFSITVNPAGQVNKPNNVVLCNNSNSSPIVFQTNNTGGTTTYAWTNNNTSIGLPAAGTGNISSFVAKNTGTTAVVATITVTPTFTLGAVSCVGSPQQFTITVNPTPTITGVNELNICDQTALNYTPVGNITGTTFNWTASVIFGSVSGLSTSGSGAITDAITNTQGGNVSSVVRYVIIPQSPAGCIGPSFDLDVNLEKCADLAISKTDGKTQYTPGTTVQYTLVVNNNGPSDAFGVIINDNAPTGTSISSWSAVYTGGASGNANGSGNLSQTINIPDNATATYTILVNVPSTFTGNLSNTASISVPTGLKDNNLANNTSTDTNTQNSQADLRLTMTGAPGTVIAGENVTYTLTLTNLGPSVAQNVQVQNVLPASLSFVSATPSKGTWAIPNWTVASLAVNETVTMTLVARVNSNVTSNVTNTATATSTTSDPVSGNNSASAATTIITRADLSIVISDSPDPVVAGETLTYTIVVKNNGPSNAAGVLVNNAIPAGVSFVNATLSQGTWNTNNWAIGNLASGSQATLALITRVNSNLTTEIVNTVAVSSTTTDPVTTNNSDSETTSISTLANLSVTKVADSNQITAGENVTYTIRVNNNGPSNALNVRIQDVLPAQLQFVSTSPETGTWAAPQWTVGALIPGQEVSMDLVATVKSDASGTIVNTATVTSDTTDPTPANNTSAHELSLQTSANLTISTTGPVEIIAGSEINYSLIVSNQGPSDAINVKVTDILPAGLSGAEYSIDGGNNWISWTGTYTRSTLAANANFEVKLRANTLASLTNGQVITNIAKASSPTALAEVDDDVVTTVKKSADLVMLKTRTAGVVLAGENIQYTLTVTNLGPSNAQNVVVTDVLPANLTFVNALPESGTWLNPKWTIGGLNAGASTSMQLIARVNAGVANGTIIINEASVTSNTTDPVTSNNSDNVSASVNTETDLAITNSVNNDKPDVGSQVVFTIRVTNQGPSNATAVSVKDLLSSGFTYVSHSGGTYNSANNIWTIGNLTINNTVELRITAIVKASGIYNPTCTVSGNENDPALNNNQASVSVVPRPIVNLALDKTVNVPYQSVGQVVEFSVAVTNNGPSNATNVRVIDNLPAGFTFQTASSVAGNYNNSTGIWSVGNLNSGSTVILKIIALVKATGPYINSAVVSANEFDPVTANNSDAAGISVIQAVDDNFNANPINGLIGGTAGNVLLNDRLQGLVIDDSKITISLIDNGGLAGLSINGNGNLVVPSNSVAGIYIARYRICEKELTDNCDTAEIVFTVNPPVILAMNDNFSSTPINGINGGVAGNVLTNDRLNNAVINPNQVTVLITQNGGLTGVSINQTGQISIPAKTRAGVYLVTYQLCEKLNPANCDDAQVTLLVAAAPILAADDNFIGNPVSGIAGGIAGNVISNDRLNGLALNVNDVKISLVNNGGITNLVINSQGQVIIPPGTTAGQYTFTYSICEVLNPDNCDQAQIIVLVSSASIIAGDDTFGPINGYVGSATAGNVLLNDRLNGEVVNISAIKITIVSIDERLQLNTGTGVLSVLSGTPQGIYELEYRICEVLNPANCDNALVSVNVVAANIVANNDAFGPVNGFTGVPNIGNILTNDMLNGIQVSLNEITLSIISMDSPLTLNVETGLMGVLPGTASGSYSAEYQICEMLNPANCDTAQVAVLVGSATIIANDDVFGPVNGFTGNSNLGNILNNDILNGISVSKDAVNITIVSSDNEQIILDTESGIVGLEPGIPAGIYEMVYRICETINPENCNTAEVTIVVVAPQMEAMNDDFGPVDGMLGSENAGNILANDRISGQEFDSSDVIISIISTTFPTGILLDTNSGNISVAPLTSGGTYTMSYRICDILNPSNCDQANVSVNVNPFADLAISKIVDIPRPGIDSQITFTLTVTNNGPNNATGVVALDELKTGFTYISDNSGGSWVPETGVWTIGDLVSGASAALDIVVKMNAEGIYINTASVSGEQPDPNTNNNVSEINLSPGETADLSIEKTLDNLVVDVNNNVVFTLTASNNGPADATNVVVTDMLPDGYTYLSHSGTGTYSSENGLWSLGSMQSGQEEMLFITAAVNPSGNYTNIAVISGDEPDGDLSNNSGEATVTAIQVADLAITKNADKPRAPEGSQVVFTLSITNFGPSTAMDVEVDDLLPSGLSYISDDGNGSYNPENGKWEIGTMVAESVASLQITALVNPVGDYLNSATVQSSTKDPDITNNSASITIITTDEADIGIVKTSNKERANVGTEVVFFITVTNYGPDNATGVIVLDLLPDGFEFVSNNGPGSYNSLTGEWVVGELANQLMVNLEIKTRIRTNGDYTNLAEVTSNEYDPISANNTDSITIAVDNELVIPEGFSPGDDGFNDRFVIYGLEQYPNNHLQIVNRWGSKVYEASPYNNDWDGSNIFGVTIGGRDLPEGTYFYILDLGENGLDPIKGFIYLKR